MLFPVFLSQTVSLFLELSLYRYLTLVGDSRFASTAVGISLLGYGYSWFLVRKWGRDSGSVLLFGRLLPVSLFSLQAVLFLVRVESLHLFLSPLEWGKFLVLLVFFSLPFAVSGAVVGCALALSPGREFTLYGASLTGGGAGVLVWWALAGVLPPGWLVATSLFLSLPLLIPGNRGKIALRLGFCFLALLASSFFASRFESVSVYSSLASVLRAGDCEIRERVHAPEGEFVVARSGSLHYRPGLSPRSPVAKGGQEILFQDGGVAAWDLEGKGEVEEVYLDLLPFLLGRKVLVVGLPRSVPLSLIAEEKSKEVLVVDERPAAVEFLKKRLVPGKGPVRVLKESPLRALLSRGIGFDLFFFPDVGALEFSATTGRPLSESYLLTEEVLEKVLLGRGERVIFAFTGWAKVPIREELRLISLLEKVAAPGRRDRFLVLYGYSRFLLFFSPGGFEGEFARRALGWGLKNGFSAIFPNRVVRGDFSDPSYEREMLRALGGETRDRVVDASPPSLDRPYFFRFLKLETLPRVRKALGKNWHFFVEMGSLFVLFTACVVFLLSLFFVFFPSLSFFARRAGGVQRGVLVSTILAGTLSGFAFTLLELLFVGRSSLFFDSQAGGFAVTLLVALTGAGSGALLSRRRGLPTVKTFLVLGFFSLPLFVVPRDELLRLALAGFWGKLLFAFLGAFSFAMAGTFFPPLIGWGERGGGVGGVALLWGFNNTASVMGAILAPLLSSSVGFRVSALAAVSLYLLYVFVVWGLRREEKRRVRFSPG
ncbi:MAG: hypothetical protein D6713_00825 [Deltaproteobacteria bacterium]|nr:MAG: hypothetical protein D6713_00825 [Deltaproteobacteria bacterium]